MPKPTRTLLKPESWPAGHRAALAVFVDLDPEETPWNISSPIANEAAVERLLATLADLDIVPTTIVDPDAEDSFPLPKGNQFDPAAHLFEAPADLSAARTSCKERLGVSPRGIVMLAGLPTLGMENQNLWFVDGSGGPFPMATAKGKVVIPYSVWWHDSTWLSTVSPSPPSALLESWSLSLASIRSRGELMTIILSGQVSGHPGHLETIQRFLDETIAAGDVWITNGSGIVDLVAKPAVH